MYIYLSFPSWPFTAWKQRTVMARKEPGEKRLHISNTCIFTTLPIFLNLQYSNVFPFCWGFYSFHCLLLHVVGQNPCINVELLCEKMTPMIFSSSREKKKSAPPSPPPSSSPKDVGFGSMKIKHSVLKGKLTTNSTECELFFTNLNIYSIKFNLYQDRLLWFQSDIPVAA